MDAAYTYASSSAATEFAERNRRWNTRMLNGSAVMMLVLLAMLFVWEITELAESPWLFLTAFGLWGATYLPLGLRIERLDITRWRLPYEIAFLLLVGVVFFEVRNGAGIFFMVVFPHVWMVSPTTRHGVVLTIGVTASAFVGMWAARSFATLPISHLFVFIVSGLISVALGYWFNWMSQATEQRWILATKLNEANAELQQLHHDQGVLNERSRLAGEIHDTLAQGFLSITALSQLASATADDAATTREHLALIEETARQNLAESRALVAAWTPPDLDAGLSAAIGRTVRRVTHNSGLDISVNVSVDDAEIDSDRDVIILRAVQEGLTNVVRHAEATHVTVSLHADAGVATLRVADNGVGMTADAAHGYGLELMQRRAADFGGSMSARALGTGGTELLVALPLPQPSDANPTNQLDEVPS